MPKMPTAEVEITTDLARRLLADQYPQLATLPLVKAGEGWDNVTVRIGDALALRLPRRELAASLILREQRFLPQIGADLPLAVPIPVFSGTPTDYYPFAWSVVPWLVGTPAAEARPDVRNSWAIDLADFLLALHQVAPVEVTNPYRGVPLADRAEKFAERMQPGSFPRSEELLPILADGVAAAPYDGPPMWLHGDLHPFNMLATGDRLSAVIDFGDLSTGDPACDLASVWLTFGPLGRMRFVSHYSAHSWAEGDMWFRARAWAAGLVATLLTSSDDRPDLAELGRHGLAQLLDHALPLDSF